MSSFFLGLDKKYIVGNLLIISIAGIIFSGCLESWFDDPAEKTGPAIRLTKGNFEDGQIRFHSEEDKLLVLRQVPKDQKSVDETSLPLERIVIEVDYSDLNYPKSKEISELKDGNFPSYAGQDKIFALNEAGGTVYLDKGSEEIVNVNFKNLKARPTKPVASPDGRYVAFLSLPIIKLNQKGDFENEENFRYQAFVADLQTGKTRQLSKPIGLYASVVSLAWGDNGLFVFYQILEKDGLSTRVEQLGWPEEERALALFTDYPPNLSLDGRYRFFATFAKRENTVTLISRGMDIEKDYPFNNRIKSVVVRHDGKYVAVSVYCEDTKGYNIYLLPVDEEFLKQVDEAVISQTGTTIGLHLQE